MGSGFNVSAYVRRGNGASSTGGLRWHVWHLAARTVATSAGNEPDVGLFEQAAASVDASSGASRDASVPVGAPPAGAPPLEAEPHANTSTGVKEKRNVHERCI